MLERRGPPEGGIPPPPVSLRRNSRGVKGTLRDSGAASTTTEDHYSAHRRTNGASVSSLFAP